MRDCESSSVAEHQLPKLDMGVRFPSLADKIEPRGAWEKSDVPGVRGRILRGGLPPLKERAERVAVRFPSLAFKFFIFAFCILNLGGCATVSSVPYPPLPPQAALPSVPGFYHRVTRGQTLWGISQLYDIGLEELVKANRIPDAARIETGRLILIPGRQKPKNIKSLAGMPLSECFAWPLRGQVISTFGQTFNNMANKGINIKGTLHSDVIAARSGRVVFYNDNFLSFGKTIIIEHADGFSTVYARNSEVFVKPGDYVSKGTSIAKAGSAGRDKNIYLHFQIRKGSIPQNPYFYLP